MKDLDISVDQLQELLRGEVPVRILDVRREEAHREWSIPGSERLPWGASAPGGGEDAVDCERFRGEDPVVVVCDRGQTSRLVAAAARRRCSVEALSLEGGMAAWSFAWNAAPVSDPGEPTSVLQLRRTGKGCLSYMVASEGEALVLDPSLDTDVYRGEAGNRGWEITGVVETHIHADHVSRGRRLADALDVPLHLPAQDRATFSFRPLRDGDAVPVGSTRLTSLHTPGHTDESVTYRLDDRYLFTGDTLFLESVGRPDLEARGEEARVREHARRLHASLGRLARLEPELLVLPAHTSEPVPFDGEPVAATLGRVRERIEVLELDEEAFVERLVASTPPTPPNYERIVELNEAGDWPADGLVELEAGANRCAAS